MPRKEEVVDQAQNNQTLSKQKCILSVPKIVKALDFSIIFRDFAGFFRTFGIF